MRNICWRRPKYVASYPVIIDNMMNLELLLYAGNHTHNASLTQLAVDHATTTIQQFLRADGSTFHVVDFDPTSGDVRTKCTHQGFYDASTWSRGQAWCIYGFTVMYRYTLRNDFKDTAVKCWKYYDEHVSGHVPLWDFDWNGSTTVEFQDASAAAVVSSALFELHRYTEDPAMLDAAQNILETLSSSVYLNDGARKEGLLLHVMDSWPQQRNQDTSLIYGEYFFVEAMHRRRASLLSPNAH